MDYISVIFLLLAITALIDLAMPFIIATFYSGYNHKTMPMSLLGSKKSPKRWEYNIWTIISGAVMIAAAYAFFETYSAVGLALPLLFMIALVLYGVGAEIMSGIFPTDPDGADATPSARVHAVTSAVGYTALILSALLLGITQLVAGQIALGVISIVCFVAASVFLALMIIGERRMSDGDMLIYTGLWQRLSMLSAYIPMLVTAIYYVSLSFKFVA